MYPCLETVNSLQIVTMHNMLLTETAGLFWPPVSKLTEEITIQFNCLFWGSGPGVTWAKSPLGMGWKYPSCRMRIKSELRQASSVPRRQRNFNSPRLRKYLASSPLPGWSFVNLSCPETRLWSASARAKDSCSLLGIMTVECSRDHTIFQVWQRSQTTRGIVATSIRFPTTGQ